MVAVMPMFTRVISECKMGTGSDGCEVPVPILTGNKHAKRIRSCACKNRPGRPHPAVPATFSRQAGEAVMRPCRTLVRLTGRFALQDSHYAHVYTRYQLVRPDQNGDWLRRLRGACPPF